MGIFFQIITGPVFYMRLPCQRRALRISPAETWLTAYRKRLIFRILSSPALIIFTTFRDWAEAKHGLFLYVPRRGEAFHVAKRGMGPRPHRALEKTHRFRPLRPSEDVLVCRKGDFLPCCCPLFGRLSSKQKIVFYGPTDASRTTPEVPQVLPGTHGQFV